MSKITKKRTYKANRICNVKGNKGRRKGYGIAVYQNKRFATFPSVRRTTKLQHTDRTHISWQMSDTPRLFRFLRILFCQRCTPTVRRVKKKTKRNNEAHDAMAKTTCEEETASTTSKGKKKQENSSQEQQEQRQSLFPSVISLTFMDASSPSSPPRFQLPR